MELSNILKALTNYTKNFFLGVFYILTGQWSKAKEHAARTNLDEWL